MEDQPQRKGDFVARSKDWFRRKKDRLKDRLLIGGSSSAPTTRPQSQVGIEASTRTGLGPMQQDSGALALLLPIRSEQSQSSPDLVTDDVHGETTISMPLATALNSGDPLVSTGTATTEYSSGGQGQGLGGPELQPSHAVTGASTPAQGTAKLSEATMTPASRATPKPSTTQNLLNRSWAFTQTLLKRLPEIVDENPVKVVLGLVKLVAEIKDAVQGNMNETEEHIVTTVAQLAILDDAQIAGWKADGPEVARLEEFKRVLKKELESLFNLKAEKMFEKIASHEDEKSEIATIFQRINEARIQFELYTNIRVLKVAVWLEQDAKRNLPNGLQPSHMADHRYRPAGEMREALQRSVCTPGTRTRILNNIITWAESTLAESEDIYWLFGPAGSGKTTIAYTVARFFDTTPATNHTITLGGNFLCSRQFDETRSETRIIRTLAYQLARKCDGFADALNELKDFDAIHQSVSTQMHSFLVVPWQRYLKMRLQRGLLNTEQFLLLVDAVDELEKKGGEEFLTNLIEAVNSATGGLQGIKFFVTSRSNPGIVKLVESLKRKKVVWLQDVEKEEVQRDIGINSCFV